MPCQGCGGNVRAGNDLCLDCVMAESSETTGMCACEDCGELVVARAGQLCGHCRVILAAEVSDNE